MNLPGLFYAFLAGFAAASVVGLIQLLWRWRECARTARATLRALDGRSTKSGDPR